MLEFIEKYGKKTALKLSPGMRMKRRRRSDEDVGDGGDELLELSPLWEGRRENDGMDEMRRAKDEEGRRRVVGSRRM